MFAEIERGAMEEKCQLFPYDFKQLPKIDIIRKKIKLFTVSIIKRNKIELRKPHDIWFKSQNEKKKKRKKKKESESETTRGR